MPEAVAQTNLQLYAQLRRAGWPVAEIEAAAKGYALAATLLAGWYRPSGKPFVDHFVGTASVVAAAGGRPALVRAALLHNAYGSVLRADGSPRVGRRERREVRDAIGLEAEDLVFAYCWFPWDDEAVAALLGRVEHLDARERDLIVVRLANEVDDRLDLGLAHSQAEPLDGRPMIELAERLGEPVLAEVLGRVVADETGATVEPGARNAATVPYAVAPRRRRRLRPASRWVRRQGRRVAYRTRQLRNGGR